MSVPAHDPHDAARDADEAQQPAGDIAERPGTEQSQHDHADELADEWGDESFPSSDPPAHY